MRVPRQFLKRHRIGLAIGAALLLLYAGLGFLLVPKLARSLLTQQLALDGRQLLVSRIAFNPFSLVAEIDGLALNDAQGKPLLAFQMLRVNAAVFASLWYRSGVLQEVRLQRPYVALVREADGSFNLSKLLPPSKPQDAPPKSSAPPRLRIQSLVVDDGKIDVKDLSRPQAFTTSFSPIRFSLKDFRTEASYDNAYQFSARAESGEQFDWSGDFSVQPLGSTGRFALRDLQALTVADYLQNQLPVQLLSGVGELNGSYTLTFDPQLSLDVAIPAIRLRAFALTERGADKANPPLSIEQLEIGDIALSLAKHTVTVGKVAIDGAQLHVQRETDGSLNLSRLLPAADSASESSTTRPPNARRAQSRKSNAPDAAKATSSAANRAASAASAASAATTATASPGASNAAAASAANAAGTVDTDTPKPAADTSETKASAWRVSVGSVHLGNAAVLVDDHALAPATHFALRPINLDVAGYSNAADAQLKLVGDLKLEPAAQLKLDGKLRPTPLDAALKLQLQGLDLAALQPYLAPYTGLRLKSGTFGSALQVHYAAAGAKPAQLAASGDVGIANFVAQDPAQQDFLKWRQLDITGIDYQQSPQKLAIRQIALTAPYARVVIEQDRSINVVQVMSPPSATASVATKAPSNESAQAVPAKPVEVGGKTPATKPATANPMPIRIDTITLAGGSANFADRSIEPQFATAIVALAGKVTGLSTVASSRAKLHFDGHVDQYAPVVIDGEINPLAASKYADVSLSFRNMDLTTFNPYSGRFAGYNIVKGKLTTELKYKIEDRKLDAQHHVVVDQLEFGDATGSKQAVPLPVRLAVSLLKDRNGVIDLQLPVAGSLDDPTFSVGPIIWHVFVNLLTKVVTAPFAAIGSLFGGGDELSYVDFAAGAASLNDTESGKLGKLAAALVERPQLRLDVPLAVAEAADRKALAQRSLDQLLPPAAASAVPKDRLKALERVYRDQLKKSLSYPETSGDDKDAQIKSRIDWIESALIERLAPDEAALQQLGKDRAQAVEALLLTNSQINAERIFVVAGSGSATTDTGGVRMALKLE